jgi:FlaG/FlaF family flagellin (archaellin)
MASMVSKRRLMVALVAVLAAFAILSFVLPYVGAGDSGLTKLFP